MLLFPLYRARSNGDFVPPPPPPTPTGGGGLSVELGDGWIRRGNTVRWLERPKELAPERAELNAVKKVAKRLGITRQAAESVVSTVQGEIGQTVNYLRAANMAVSGRADDLYTPDEISGIRDYWKQVVQAATDLEDDDEIMLLLT